MGADAKYRELARLTTTEFRHTREHLEGRVAILQAQIRDAEEPNTIFRIQGRIREISELLSLIQKARDLVD